MCLSKHVEQLRNIGIINFTTRSHFVGYFYKIYIMMHGSMNIKLTFEFASGVCAQAVVGRYEFYNKLFSILLRNEDLDGRFRWPRGLGGRSAAACLLRLWVRNPLGHRCIFLTNVVLCQVKVPATG